MTQIYFASAGERIKIGISRNVPERLRGLQIREPERIELIGTIKGNGEVERAIHKKLSPFRIEGEWFRNCPETRAAITNCFNNFAPADPDIGMPYGKFVAVVRLLWPRKTAAHLAALGKVTERGAHMWLSGKREPPARILAAILVEITTPDSGNC